jgi:uncharacterized protein YndB with AHSA1/START domain/DNA-binding transcriptional ArsR family regulator
VHNERQPNGCTKESAIDDLFHALADPTRRDLLDRLGNDDGQTLTDLCTGLAMSRQAVTKHLDVLERAGLVTVQWRGREKRHFLNTVPIAGIADRWIRRFDRPRLDALATLQSSLENPSMAEYVYVTFIRTTPERLWQALTDPAFTAQYWGITFESDWTPGSTMAWTMNDRRTEHPEQQVLESDPPRRLAYTWHTFTPEWAEGYGLGEDVRTALAAEPRSHVVYDLEPQGDAVKLTITHRDLVDGGTLIGMIADGWPSVAASLKSLLETGDPLHV